MRIDVRLFASYREAAGMSRFDVELPAGAAVRDALVAITQRHPRLAAGGRILTARNREYVDAEALLADGDELALIPPVSGGAGAPGQRILVTASELSVDDVIAAVRDGAHGGIVVFIGTVRERNRGQRVLRLDYEAYPEMAEATMRDIATRLETAHDARVAMHHRVGELAIGDTAVVVAAGSAHRDAAFAAARAAIDELKTVVPIWKKEHTEDGAIWLKIMPSSFIQELQRICGPDNVFWRPEDLIVFEYDAGFDRQPPSAVVVPGTAEEVAGTVRAARAAGVSIVPRGAGTGLSGGTVACAGAIVVSTNRLSRIIRIDPQARAALVEPGVVNIELTRAAREHGLFFAPDPASQLASSIGGNIGTNAGGPHALRYGSVVNHVLGIEMVLPDGTVTTFGGRAGELPGYDCVPFIVGSEGTLGIVTKAWVRLLPLPEDVRTFTALFPDIDSGARAATAIIAKGIVPAAMEMLDRVTIEAVNAAFDVGLSAEAGSLLLVEVEGLREECEDAADAIEVICREHGAFDVRMARSKAERELLWKARKMGYPALARIKPNNYLHDAVVPRSKVPAVLREVNAIAARYGLIVANMFHIGDGNLHPILLFDAREEKIERVMEASAEILKVAIEAGGALSGEHGIGLEKNHFMFWVYAPEDLEAMQRGREAFDPERVMNPGKVFPGGAQCAAIPTERIKRGLAEGMWI